MGVSNQFTFKEVDGQTILLNDPSVLADHEKFVLGFEVRDGRNYK